MITLARLEIARMAGDIRFLLLMLALPVGMYLLFTNLFGAAANQPSDGLPPALAVMISMAAFGAIGTALSATAPRIAQERATGWTRQLRIMPMPGRTVVIAKLLAAMAWVLPAILLVFLTAVLDHGVSLTAAQWLTITGLLWVGTAPFAALGILIGYLSGESAAFPVLYGMLLFLGAAGGLWMPVSSLPLGLQRVAHVLPSNRLADFGWRIAEGLSARPVDGLVLAAWLAGFAGPAVIAYRRTALAR
jgi:ABC-2 type transport system permease protein